MKDWLIDRAKGEPNRIVLTDGEEEYSYRRLNEEAWEIVGALWEEVQAGDRVAILGLNSTFHLLMGFACWRLGATLVPLNYRLSDRELTEVLQDCDPVLTLFDEQNAGRVEGRSFSQVLAEKKPYEGTPYPLQPEDPALILYTSGTTGKPKGAILPHRMLLANIRNTVQGWELTSCDRSLLFAPLFHTGGWNVLTLPLIHAGGHLTMMETFDARRILDSIKAGEVTVLFGVPTMFDMMNRQWDLTREETDQIRFFISGGAPCPAELIESYLERGINFRQGFGMTEVGPNCFYFPANKVREKMGTVGKPMPGTRVEIRGEGDTGLLAIGGDHVFGGYLNNPQATSQTLVDNMVITGDLARKDKDGFFTIVGRKKEMFISGGENVFPAEVEKEIHSHPASLESAVVGVDHPKWGEVGAAFVILGEGQTLTEEILKEYLRNRLAHYKVPHHYYFVEDFPRNSMGKIKKGELVELHRKSLTV